MTTETKTKLDRIDNDTIELKTIITQKLTNQEFYDLWANMGMTIAKNKEMIKNNQAQIKQGELQIKINEKQRKDLTKLAKDCEARL